MSGDFRIGEWLVQPALNRLRRGDEIVRVEPKVMQVLVCLAEHPGEVVTREALIARVWPDVFVTDDVLHRAVRELRRVFGDATSAPRYIETIRKRGYRLIADTPSAALIAPIAPPIAPEHDTAPHAPVAPVAPVAPGFLLLASALAIGCAAVIISLLIRPDIVTEARPRFAAIISSPLNESDPAIAPDGQRIAYVMRADGSATAQADIYLHLPGTPGGPRRAFSSAVGWRPDGPGSMTMRITDDPADDRMPAWSPDGRRLAFIRLTPDACQIYVHAIDDRTEQRVAACGNSHEPRVAWTMDGNALLFSEAPAGAMHKWRIVRLSLTNGDRVTITNPPDGVVGDHSPAISPDGTTVAFIRHYSGGVADVHVVPITGGTPRRITFDDADVTGVDWTSEGRALVYSSDRAGGYTLWRVPIERGGPQLVAGGAARLKHPVSARHMERVIYESWNYEINIWQVGLGGLGGQVGQVRQVGQVGQVGDYTDRGVAVPVVQMSDMWNLYPQISADGRRLAYVSTQSGSHELWVAARDGSDAKQVTNFGAEPQARSRGTSVRAPRWSPDSTRIVLAAHRQGASDVYVVDVNTGAVIPLTSDASVEIAPSWSHDGNRIYYGVRSGELWNVWAREAKADSEPVIAVPNGFAAQAAADGSLFFTRATERGLWRVPAGGDSPMRLTDTVPAGDWANWSVTSRGVFLVARSGYDIVLRHMRLDGGEVRQLAVLENYSWPGFTITPDGSHILYPRWDRRQSNLMAVEMGR